MVDQQKNFPCIFLIMGWVLQEKYLSMALKQGPDFTETPYGE
jgi:hypothetical protein